MAGRSAQRAARAPGGGGTAKSRRRTRCGKSHANDPRPSKQDWGHLEGQASSLSAPDDFVGALRRAAALLALPERLGMEGWIFEHTGGWR